MAGGRLPIAGAGRAEQPQHVLASLLSDAVESVEHEHVANGGPDLRVIDPVGLASILHGASRFGCRG